MLNALLAVKKLPDAGIYCTYAIDKYSKAYGEIVSWFRLLANDNILQPYLTQKNFIASTNYLDDNAGFNIYVFDIRHYQDYSSAQPTKVGFDSRPAIPAGNNLIGYALLLTNKLVSLSSDGQKQFDMI